MEKFLAQIRLPRKKSVFVLLISVGILIALSLGLCIDAKDEHEEQRLADELSAASVLNNLVTLTVLSLEYDIAKVLFENNSNYSLIFSTFNALNIERYRDGHWYFVTPRYGFLLEGSTILPMSNGVLTRDMSVYNDVLYSGQVYRFRLQAFVVFDEEPFEHDVVVEFYWP